MRDGIKFATIVRANPATTSREDIGDHIMGIVNKASHIRDRSLYEGEGFDEEDKGVAHFLILGRVEPRRFSMIRDQIIEPLVETPAIIEHYTPPLTYIATGPEVTRRTYQDGIRHT
jgi:hypothetical protein